MQITAIFRNTEFISHSVIIVSTKRDCATFRTFTA